MANVVSEHSENTNDHVGGGAGTHADPSSGSAPSSEREGGTIGIGTPVDPDELKRRKKRAEQPDETEGQDSGAQQDPGAGV